MNRNFREIWDQLRARKSSFEMFLEEMKINHLRGIQNLTLRFEFPVTVVSGPNGVGKSTLLLSAACAYKTQQKSLVPGIVFPNLKKQKELTIYDEEVNTSLEYYYRNSLGKSSMVWRKGKSWNKSFKGLIGGTQPEREIYLRTLSNLTSPNEIRSFLQMKNSESELLSSDLIAFAHRVLPNKYLHVYQINKAGKDLLFVETQNQNYKYSEFHMSAGERSILRISKDISNMKNALILIDEIEAGLHPFTQQQLMLELQRIALRNSNQLIVTTHSPTIIESVPLEGRIFLERDSNQVRVVPAYQIILQKALYGQSIDKLSILCEDGIAEYFLLGILDVLNPKINLTHNDIIVGRDTGKSEFPKHIDVMGKFNRLDDFIFVLDGDGKDVIPQMEEAGQKYQKKIQPLFLPGLVPEEWMWSIIKQNLSSYSQEFGLTEMDLNHLLTNLDLQFDNATDKKRNILKNKFNTFSETIKRDSKTIARIVSRKETLNNNPELNEFIIPFSSQLENWKSRR
jgi:predicted ATPase